LQNVEVGVHALQLLEGLWPELVQSWRMLTHLSDAPGVTSGVATTQFSGISYISPAHVDAADLLFTAGLTLKKNEKTLGDIRSNAMVVAPYMVCLVL
jgi:hypothetical protein